MWKQILWLSIWLMPGIWGLRNCGNVNFSGGGKSLLAEERKRVTFDTAEAGCLVKLRVLLVGGGGDGAAFGGNGGGSGYVVYDEVCSGFKVIFGIDLSYIDRG